MDFRIMAFLGPVSALQEWKRLLPSAAVVALTDELGLVPVTGNLRQELRRFLKAERQSDNDVIQLWGAHASKDCTIAYISADCFGDFYSDGIQYAYSWTNQQAIQSALFINDALRLLGVKVRPGEREFAAVDLGRYPDTESWASAGILAEAFSRVRGAVPALIKALKNRGSEPVQVAVRRDAAAALGRHGPAAKKVIAALVECASGEADLHVRQEAIRALGSIGRKAVPALIRLLRTHKDRLARADAAEALGDLGCDARDALPPLIEALHQGNVVLRLVAARALGKLYMADQQLSAAFQALAESATADPRASVRVSAVRALASVGPEAAPALTEVLRIDNDPNARRDAAVALGDFARAGRDTAGGLGKGCQ